MPKRGVDGLAQERKSLEAILQAAQEWGPSVASVGMAAPATKRRAEGGDRRDQIPGLGPSRSRRAWARRSVLVGGLFPQFDRVYRACAGLDAETHMKKHIIVIALLAGGGTSLAQQDASTRLRPITGPIRNAGTYHLASNTWTRAAGQASLVGTSTIYNNTCPSGYYLGLSGDTFVDEGRIPGHTPGEPNDAQNRPGCADVYSIDGFQIGYCTDQTATTLGTYTISFFESYVSCSSTIGVTPTASFALHGLPATVGYIACWIVNIDLDASPGTPSLSFTMRADGDGTYGTVPDTFGWEMSSNTASAVNTGPIIAGDPSVCAGYDGTRWDPTVNYGEHGTGMGTQSLIYIEQGPTTPGCYYFGPMPPNPFASFHLRLFSTAPCITGEPGAPYCFGDGVPPHVRCPCQNASSATEEVGCLDSFGIGGRLRASGMASVSSDTLTLLGSQMPPTSTCLYFQGTIEQHEGNGTQFGDGLRCAGGTITRLGAKGNVAGASQYPSTGDPSVSVHGAVLAGQARTYQVWYRNVANFCTSATFNLTNGYHIVWQP